MSSVSVLLLPEVLRERLGQDGAQAFIDVLNESARNIAQTVSQSSASRAEERISEVNAAIANLRAELKKDISETKLEVASAKTELKVELGNLRIEIKEGLANTKVDLLKWTFLFWAGQLVGLGGLMFYLLKH